MTAYSPLVRGVAVALAVTGLFALTAVNALRGGPLQELDVKIARDMMEGAGQWDLVRLLAVIITHSGGVAAMVTLGVLGVFWQAWRGRGKWRVAVGWALIALSGAGLNTALKISFQRDRPPPEWRDRAVDETNESFPSGHAMGATIGIGLLGYAIMLKERHWRANLLIVLALGAWALSVGFSRIYLRAHWFSDVVGGFLIGLAWLSLGLGALETWRIKVGDKVAG